MPRPFPLAASGAATLRELTDEEAWALCPGDVVIVETQRGPAPLLVDRVRTGVAYDGSPVERPFEVPIVEGWIGGLVREGERPSGLAGPACLCLQIDDEILLRLNSQPAVPNEAA